MLHGSKNNLASVRWLTSYTCLILITVLSSRCSLIEDSSHGVPNDGIVLREDGLIETVFKQDLELDQILYSVRNISGKDIGKLVLAIRLYSNPIVQSSESLMITKMVELTLAAGKESDPVFIIENYPALNDKTIRVQIIQIDNLGTLGDLPGEFRGAYTLVDVAKDDSVSYMAHGYIDYTGNFVIEAQHSPDLFTFIEGTMNSNAKFDAFFMKADRSVVANGPGDYTFLNKQVKIVDHSINDSYKVSLQLTRIQP